MVTDLKIPVLQGTPTKLIPHIYFIYIDKIHVQIPTPPHVYPIHYQLRLTPAPSIAMSELPV